MKKCNYCEGRGYTFVLDKKTFYGIPVGKETGVRKQCTKCFGKGVKSEQTKILGK
ncbi:hypothetical protein [Gottfriedia acidiceleris]|uniref:hypothetical protein n=1 Tax=Gottfriedia acidiceleris TaxID=371036 RepID=UPI0013E9C1E4|nr:hypothetical protein [Gottfriedia acidiceleris]